MIKELAKQFEGESNCLGENTEKYKTFSVSITKEVKKIDKSEEENIKTYLTSCNSLIELQKKTVDTYKFSNHGINKFIFLLQKVAYPHE